MALEIAIPGWLVVALLSGVLFNLVRAAQGPPLILEAWMLAVLQGATWPVFALVGLWKGFLMFLHGFHQADQGNRDPETPHPVEVDQRLSAREEVLRRLMDDDVPWDGENF